MKTPIDYRFFAIKYVFEFFVVVLGITVSFWVDEWNEQRKLDRYHVADAKAMLEDLAVDAKRLEYVSFTIARADSNTARLLENIEQFRAGTMSYDALADSIVEVGYVYTYSTFFMNNGTYKSLINNGRIQRFPLEVEKEIKDYYEFVSKRVQDNNRLVDDAAWEYYSLHHPLCHAIENLSSSDSKKKASTFLRFEDMKSEYSNTSFYKANISLRNRIQMHARQVEGYQSTCALVDSLVRAHLGEIEALH